MLDEGSFAGIFGREILCCSANFDIDGPGKEVGIVKSRATSANKATLASSCAVRRGVIRGIGLPKKVCCTGILKTE